MRALWPALRVSIGAHPHQAHVFAGREAEVEALSAPRVAATPGVMAIGEIGLDYHYDFSPRDVQRHVFASQVRLARELRLPVVVHTREADDDTVGIIRSEGGGGRHRASSTASRAAQSLARLALDLGFMLSFSGIVTFPRAEPLRRIAAGVPADRLLVETDCPYLAPVPMRGQAERAGVGRQDRRGPGRDQADAGSGNRPDRDRRISAGCSEVERPASR